MTVILFSRLFYFLFFCLYMLTRFLPTTSSLLARFSSKEMPQMAQKITCPVLKLEKGNLDHVVNRAVEVLQNGGVIAMPTDTIYGLACLADRPSSVQRLYDVKTRPDNKPIAACMSKAADLAAWVSVDYLPRGLLDELLPGPVTVVLDMLPNSKITPGQPGLTRLGVRVPDYEFSIKLAGAIPGGVPLALTSANSSGEPSALNVQEFANLWPRIDLVVDGGEIIPIVDNKNKQRTGSTVIDLSTPGQFFIIRHGINAEKYIDLLKTKYGFTEKVSN